MTAPRTTVSSVEGIAFPTLGRPENAPVTPATSTDPGQAPFLRGNRAQASWQVRSLIAGREAPEANALALAELAGGADSLWVRCDSTALPPTALRQVLDGVVLEAIPLILDHAGSAQDVHGAITELVELVERRESKLHPDSSLGLDPVGRWVRRTWTPEPQQPAGPGWRDGAITQALAPVVSRAQDLEVSALVVDGVPLAEAGAGDAGEVGYSLAVGAAYLRALVECGVSVAEAAGLISFRYAVTDEQMATIAKLRAARWAWHRILELSGIPADSRQQRQHAVTSPVMFARYDPHTNMLRATVATFAAAVGGADAITSLPFDAAITGGDGFSHRMARNISALLRGESQVDLVADPAGGAWAVEEYTQRIAAAAWQEMQAIEAAGGIVAALSDGSLAERVGATRHERDQRLATRTFSLTGINQFPQFDEAALSDNAAASGAAWLSAYRWSAQFEAMRDQRLGPVVLLPVGTEAAATARVQFSQNLLAAGGLDVVVAAPGAAPQEVLSRTGAELVVIAGNDRDYGTQLSELAAAVRQAGAHTIALAGRPREVLEQLPADAIDITFAAGDDIIAVLGQMRAAVKGENA